MCLNCQSYSRCPGLSRHARINLCSPWAQHCLTSNGDVRLQSYSFFRARFSPWASSPVKHLCSASWPLRHYCKKNQQTNKLQFHSALWFLGPFQTAAGHCLCRIQGAFTSSPAHLHVAAGTPGRAFSHVQFPHLQGTAETT